MSIFILNEQSILNTFVHVNAPNVIQYELVGLVFLLFLLLVFT